MVELKLALAKGEVHHAGECNAEVVRRIYATKSALLALPSWLSSELQGLDAPAIRRRLRTEIEKLLISFAGSDFERYARLAPGTDL